MKTAWTMIRVPQELAHALHQEAAAMQEAHATGRKELPSEYIDRTPLHAVIAALLEERQAHRQRARAQKAK